MLNQTMHLIYYEYHNKFFLSLNLPKFLPEKQADRNPLVIDWVSEWVTDVENPYRLKHHIYLNRKTIKIVIVKCKKKKIYKDIKYLVYKLLMA